MCGLIGILSKKGKPAGQKVAQLYQQQKSRGQKGYGYLGIQDNKIVSKFRCLEEHEILPQLNKEKVECIFFHHRKPTSTPNLLGSTHPIFVSHKSLDYDYYVAHNGVLKNENHLKNKHEELGFVYHTEYTEIVEYSYVDGRKERTVEDTSFNDSESMAIEVALHLEGEKRINIVGSAAFWAIRVEKGTDNVVSVHFAHNYGRPLKKISNNKWFGISSETGKPIEVMKMFSIDWNEMTIENQELSMDEDKTYTHNYRTSYFDKRRAFDNRFYSLKEIQEGSLGEHNFYKKHVNGLVYYVPYVYAGENEEQRRLPYPDTSGELPDTSGQRPDTSGELPTQNSVSSDCIDEYNALSAKQRGAFDEIIKRMIQISYHIDYCHTYYSDEGARAEEDSLLRELIQLEERAISMGISPDLLEYQQEYAKELGVIDLGLPVIN